MLCSGSANYVAHYANDDKGYPCVGSIIFDDNIGMTSWQQRVNMMTYLQEGCGGTLNGVVDPTYFKYKASIITPNSTENIQETIVADINFTVQYTGNNSSEIYPKLISMTVNDVAPGLAGGNIHTAIATAVTSIISSTDVVTTLSDFKMKAFDIHVRKVG